MISWRITSHALVLWGRRRRHSFQELRIQTTKESAEVPHKSWQICKFVSFSWLDFRKLIHSEFLRSCKTYFWHILNLFHIRWSKCNIVYPSISNTPQCTSPGSSVIPTNTLRYLSTPWTYCPLLSRAASSLDDGLAFLKFPSGLLASHSLPPVVLDALLCFPPALSNPPHGSSSRFTLGCLFFLRSYSFLQPLIHFPERNNLTNA